MKVSDIGRGPAKPIPPEIQTVDGFLSAITAKHAEFYAENPDTEFRPILMVLCENGDLFPVMIASDGSEEEKELFCLQMKVAFKLWRVKSYVHATEAWLSFAAAKQINPDGTIDDDKRASQQADRKEVLFTVAIDKGGNQASNCMEIIKDYRGNRHLIPFDLPEGISLGGRFTELL